MISKNYNQYRPKNEQNNSIWSLTNRYNNNEAQRKEIDTLRGAKLQLIARSKTGTRRKRFGDTGTYN